MDGGKGGLRQSLRGQTAGGYSMSNIPQGQNMQMQEQMDGQQHPMTAQDGVNMEDQNQQIIAQSNPPAEQ